MDQTNQLFVQVSRPQAWRLVRLGISVLAIASFGGCVTVPRMETSDRTYVCGTTHHVGDTVVRVLDGPQWRFSTVTDCPSGSMLTPIQQQPQLAQAALDGVLKQSALQLRVLPMFGRPGEPLPVPPWLKGAPTSGGLPQGPGSSGQHDVGGK